MFIIDVNHDPEGLKNLVEETFEVTCLINHDQTQILPDLGFHIQYSHVSDEATGEVEWEVIGANAVQEAKLKKAIKASVGFKNPPDLKSFVSSWFS